MSHNNLTSVVLSCIRIDYVKFKCTIDLSLINKSKFWTTFFLLNLGFMVQMKRNEIKVNILWGIFFIG